ncbi:MAG TPA: TetR/AcrR family transcriptional regulator [Puia sp.]|nr:TetR/AcrR family transcriptional regulator [Puia sp.]
MPGKRTIQPTDDNTEARIKAAARAVFHKKGFAATRTRDIADEAKINLALLNYYFRSKEKLFQLIMIETLTGFFQNMSVVFNDEETTFEEKVQLGVERYIDLLIEEPGIPIFILSEIRSHGAGFLEKLPIANTIMQSVFIRQYKEAAKKGGMAELNPLHFLMNLVGLVVFPFVNSPMLKKIGKLKDRQFDKLMEERKKLIPVWVNTMLKAR